MDYTIIKETLFHEDIGSYQTYGIKYKDLITISDVSQDILPLEHFVTYLNEAKVDINWIYHAIDQFLSVEQELI